MTVSAVETVYETVNKESTNVSRRHRPSARRLTSRADTMDANDTTTAFAISAGTHLPPTAVPVDMLAASGANPAFATPTAVSLAPVSHLPTAAVPMAMALEIEVKNEPAKYDGASMIATDAALISGEPVKTHPHAIMRVP